MAEIMSGAWHWILLGVSIIIVLGSMNVNKLDLKNYSVLGIVVGLILGYVFGNMYGHNSICICSGVLIGLGFGLGIRKE